MLGEIRGGRAVGGTMTASTSLGGWADGKGGRNAREIICWSWKPTCWHSTSAANYSRDLGRWLVLSGSPFVHLDMRVMVPVLGYCEE
jgi:hypothetical protein